MQSLGHACIFCTSNPRGQTTFFASYVLVGNLLSFGSIFFIIFSNFSNPLLDTPFSGETLAPLEKSQTYRLPPGPEPEEGSKVQLIAWLC